MNNDTKTIIFALLLLTSSSCIVFLLTFNFVESNYLLFIIACGIGIISFLGLFYDEIKKFIKSKMTDPVALYIEKQDGIREQKKRKIGSNEDLTRLLNDIKEGKLNGHK